MPAEKYANIERNDVREGHKDWTEGKEDAAAIIQDKINQGEWPVSLEQLEEDTKWSRSHFRNTLRDLFSKKKQDNQEESTHRNHKQIEIPEHINCVGEYLEGVAKGYNLARKE